MMMLYETLQRCCTICHCVSNRCEVVGGGSTVDPRLYLLDNDVTSGFSISRSCTTVGARCMRRERYVTARWSEEFMVSAEHDGEYINCSVVVPRFPVPVASRAAILTVRCKYSRQAVSRDSQMGHTRGGLRNQRGSDRFSTLPAFLVTFINISPFLIFIIFQGYNALQHIS